MSRHRRHRSRGRHHDPEGSAPDARAALELDRLGPSASLAAGAATAAAHRPAELIVETPERVAAREARDVRDGVKKADRRPFLYFGIAVVVALVVFGILSLIESRGGL